MATTPNQDEETQFSVSDPAPTAGQQSYAQSGQFHDIQRLLNANQGQGGAYANHAISTAGGLADQAQSQLSNAQSAYQSQAQAATPASAVKPSGTAPTSTSGQIATAAQSLANRGYGSSIGTNYATPGATQKGTYVNGSAAPIASKYATPGSTQGGTYVNGSGTPTSTVGDRAAYTQQLQNQAGATYQGPNSLLEAQGVNPAALQAAFGNATAAGRALVSTTGLEALNGETGGRGLLDSLVARNNYGSQLAGAQGRFSGLQSLLNSAVANTAPTDAAKAAVANNATAAQAALKAQTDAANAKSAAATQKANATSTQDAHLQSAYQDYLSGRQPNGPALGTPINPLTFEQFKQRFGNNG